MTLRQKLLTEIVLYARALVNEEKENTSEARQEKETALDSMLLALHAYENSLIKKECKHANT